MGSTGGKSGFAEVLPHPLGVGIFIFFPLSAAPQLISGAPQL